MRFRSLATLATLLCLAPLVFLGTSLAQTITTGQLSGTVTDPSGAVMPNLAVQLKSLDDGSITNGKTNGQGYYLFTNLKPGNYSANVSAPGFQSAAKQVVVALGGNPTLNFQLTVGSSTTTVEVTGAAAAVETEDANLNTNFSSKQVELLPNPGNDLSAVALTSPGAVMNTAGGAMFGGGNFEVYGLPATSNLFTVDGSNYNDPYFNINNSGATNLTLGLNDVQESTVVANGYSGSYGGLAGANINYVSKSGTNAFHGNAEYWWNGDVMNANNYFRVQNNALAGSNVAPRPFVNANQYAGSIGGPIVKDKAFFFFDYEGIQLAIPSPVQFNIPTPAFQAAVLTNLTTPVSAGGAGLTSASTTFYTHLFNLYNAARSGGSPLPGGGCSDVTTLAGVTFGAANPCAVQISGGGSAHTHDAFYAGRTDFNIGNNDKLFVRVEHEHGLQATYTDPISNAFNAHSDQPQWQSNVQETHNFGTDKVNTFNTSLLWYSAGFTLANPSAALSPTTGLAGVGTIGFLDGSLQSLGGLNIIFPQGRNITQYQFVDDFSWVRGRHNFKVGVNFRRDDINDQNFTITTPYILEFSLSQFANGGGASFDLQNFPNRTEVPIALYQLGGYVADDVRVTNNLKLTLSVRLDHISNPVCQINCFQHLVAPFDQLSHTGPVNAAIAANQHQAFPSVTEVAAQPKIGFAWSPFGLRKTVLRGGIGIFADALPTGAIDSFLQQAPLDLGFSQVNVAPITPTETGSVNATLVAEAAAFKANYAGGALSCGVPGASATKCVPPFSFYNATKGIVPRYYEWSLELQQDIGWHTTLSTMYVGNHGSHEEISNGALNAWCCASGQFTSGLKTFANFPTAPPDPRFGQVSDQANVANSNYAGLVVGLTHSMGGGFQFQANYTWSHALDEISNNSLSPFGLNTTGQYADVIYPEDPFSIRRFNYGNADYDIRHNFTMNYVWSDAFRHLTHWGPNALMKGWSFSGTIFRHSGLPMTIYDNTYSSALSGTNYGAGTQYIFANITGNPNPNCSGAAAHVNPDGSANPCFGGATGGLFADPTTTYPGQRRNQFHGPGYFNTDFAVEKGFGIPKWEGSQFSIGARFFNIFNHPNFDFPIMNFNNPQFGQIIQTVSSPTSIYGSGLGADASPRIIQFQAKLTF
jgi:hypothetical protein